MANMLRFFLVDDQGVGYCVISEGDTVRVCTLGTGSESYGRYLIIADQDKRALLYDEKEQVRMRINYQGLFLKRETATRCRHHQVRPNEKLRSTNVVLNRVHANNGVAIFR